MFRITRSRFLASLLFSLGLVATVVAQAPVINEYMAANSTTIVDDDGDYSDWIELHNPGAVAFDLTGCYLGDDAADPLRWQFLGGTIPPQGYLLVWASGKDRPGPTGALHTNFAISADGEPLLLTAADGVTRLDEVAAAALASDVSRGRLPDATGSWVEFGLATPGQSNASGLLALAAPSFSVTPGLFTGPITLALLTDDPQATIAYTLDGSEPTLASTPYGAPLMLDGRAGDPNTISLIPTNHRSPEEFTGWRPPRGEVFKINVVRARAFKHGHAPSRVVTGSYVIAPDLAAAAPLAVVSLATEPDHLFADDIGIYVPGDTYIPNDLWSGNYFQSGDEWERPIHLELFDTDGSLILAQDAGARIHGNYTRHFPQKTLRMSARAQYGPSEFSGVVFPDLPADDYEHFLIRNVGNDWCRLGFRDLVFQAMCAGMGFDTQAGRPVVHFINGEYWGIANLRERYDRHYLERTYGVPGDEVALLSSQAFVEEGTAADRADFLALSEFVSSNDMSLPSSLAHVAERMDLENFIAYNVAEIYAANRDWPGNNIRRWRRTLAAYNPDAPYGHDGRWRWMMYDVDDAFSIVTFDGLAHATEPDGPSWPNPPWSTALLRGLLGNQWFSDAFINGFADHLNSTFEPTRLIGVIDAHADTYEAAIGAWQDRWDVTVNWPWLVQSLRTYVSQRPTHLRQHVRDHFDLAGDVDVTLAVSDPDQGKVQVNSLLIDADLAGLPDPAQPYPWTGAYFQGVPITVSALPGPGHRFVAWQPGGSPDPVLTITPGAAPLQLTAIFAADDDLPIVLHAWHFNALADGVLTEVVADASLLGGAAITYPGTGDGYLDRVTPGTLLGGLPEVPAGDGLRVRNPSDTRELLITIPSTGLEVQTVQYAVMRTSNGAEAHSVFCRVEPAGPWLPVALDLDVTDEYQFFAHDLTPIAGSDDNPDLVLKVVFGGANAGGSSGNQRFDNLTVLGRVLAGTNLPPVVVQPLGLQQAIEAGDPIVVDLAQVFADPDDDPLAFAAVSDDPGVASTSLAGSLLTVMPLVRGGVWITTSATDGTNDPVAHRVRLLIHPAAKSLAAGAHAFTTWDPDQPERTYPEHMLFLQSEVDDPGLAEPLRHPYHIDHDDYHADDQETIGFPYNNTGRTRINGLGDGGISFINTGRGRDLGGAVLALDTRGQDAVTVGWLGGTVVPNQRTYAIRLQYRTAIDDEFADLLQDGFPVEYQRTDQAGHTQVFGPLSLPAELLDQPYVQLMWRYYHVAGTEGPRDELRLDEVTAVGNVETGVAGPSLPAITTLEPVAPNPFNPATVISFGVQAGEVGRLAIYNSRGQRLRSLGRFLPGHHRIRWDGTDDRGQRLASGVYFCRLSTGNGHQSRKMLMLN